MINDQEVNSEFYTAEQKDLIRKIFEGIIHPEWHAKFDKQLEDDCGGFARNRASPSSVNRAMVSSNSC